MILETLRSQDLPAEILDDENLSVTLPRRLGLSDVIERQIRHLAEEARRNRRLRDGEVLDLMQLVLRRPDAREVFHQVGRDLHGAPDGTGMRRFLPRGMALRLARRRTARFLQVLFGRRVVRSAGPGFQIEAGPDLPGRVETDGAVCGLVSGLAEASLARYFPEPPPVVHRAIQPGPEGVCQWAVEEPDSPDSTPGEATGNNDVGDG